jgi:thiol-disulfide isomerase/thioredoxin
MATRKSRRGRPRKTVRRRRSSTAGKILPPLDVRSNKHLREFEKRIKSGDLTIILVWAQWCPHCHTMMPHFDAAAKSPNRSIQAVKVEETMVPAVNQILTKNINRAAKPLNVEGYPSIIVVDKQGNQVTNLEPVRNTTTMTKVMEQAGPLATQAGLNTPSEDPQEVANNLQKLSKNQNISNNNMANANALLANGNKNMKGPKLANLGIEEEGLVTGTNSNSVEAIASPKNFDVGEEELEGSIASENTGNTSIKLKSISQNNMTNAGKNSKLKVTEKLGNAVAPSPLNTFSNSANKTVTPPAASIKKFSEEAEEVTSLAAPLTPPSALSDIESSENVESISNTLTPAQKVGGGGRGGSLYSSLARTTYTLAPAAALLATAAMVMKGKKRQTRRKSKKTRKTRHRR